MANLFINPTFTGATGTTPPTSWTVWEDGVAPTFSVNTGQLTIGNSSGDDGGVYQALSLVSGGVYSLSIVVNTATTCHIAAYAGTTVAGSDLGFSIGTTGQTGTFSFSFTATTSTTYLSFLSFNAGAGSSTLIISSPSLTVVSLPASTVLNLSLLGVG